MRRTAVAAAALLAATACGTAVEPLASRPVARAQRLVFFDERAFARALARAERTPARAVPGARAVIVPHHWLAGHLILRGLRDLAASGHWTRVILIGPNHTGAGGAPVATSDRSWPTPFGTVQADGAAADALVRPGPATAEPEVLTYEHSIAGLVPALAATLPGASIVPVALRSDLRMIEVRALARALARLADDRTALVASVDFSHYLSAAQARARDRETLVALRTLDAPRVLSFGNEHMDSPPTIAVVIETMRLLGATRFVLRESGNSVDVSGVPHRSTTSYILGFYART